MALIIADLFVGNQRKNEGKENIKEKRCLGASSFRAFELSENRG